MSWKKVKLGDLCDMNSGGTPRRNNPDYYNGNIPWAKISDIESANGFIKTTEEKISIEALQSIGNRIFPKGTLLLAMYGSVGKTAITGIEMSTNQAILGIRPKDESKIYLPYLKYWFHFIKESLMHRAVGGTLQNISLGIVKELQISLPPLAIQQKIAAILDQADALRKKDRQLLAKYDELLQAVFYDMFGDPVKNEKGWDILMFSEVGSLDRGVSKHRPRNAKELLGGPYPLIQTGDIANSEGYIREFKSTYSEIGLKQSKLWKEGTLCITIAANIAKTGILTFDACFPDSVVGFIPNKKTNVEFIQLWLSHLQEMLEATAPESAQKNINLEILRNLSLPVPPIELQNQFAQITQQIQQQKQKVRKQIDQSENLFQSLLQQAFNEELVKE